MKRVLKNREESIRSVEFKAGPMKTVRVKFCWKAKGKDWLTVDQGLGLINLQMWNPKKWRIMKLNHIIFPLWLLAKLYNSDNVTVTLLLPWNSRKIVLLAVCGQGSIISSSFHWLVVSPVDIYLRWRHAMFTTLRMAKSGNRFSQEYLVFKWIYRVYRIDGF